MKRFQAWFVLSGILVLVGVILLIPPSSLEGTLTGTVEPGYFHYVQLSVFKAGQISGTFSEASGRVVNLYVFDSGQFNTFRNQYTPPALVARSGSSGSFSTPFSLPGTYYLVVDHGPGLEQSNQTVSLAYKLDGMNLFIIGSGIGSLIAGVGFWVFGSRAKKTVERAPQAQGVILFDQPQVLPPPPGQPQSRPVSSPITFPPPLLVPAGPAEESQSLRQRLEKVESEIRRMDEMRDTEELMNRELFEKAYSGKVEEAEEIRRKIGASKSKARSENRPLVVKTASPPLFWVKPY